MNIPNNKDNFFNSLIIKFNQNFVQSLPNNFGTTPLHWTATIGYENITELLIKNKADVNYVDAYGKTALDLSVMYNNAGVADILIKNGGKTHLVDSRGRRALNFAINFGYLISFFKLNSP